MKNAIIIYKSGKGTTKNFSENISNFLSKEGLNVDIKSIEDTDPSEVTGYEFIFPGCWTKKDSSLFYNTQKKNGFNSPKNLPH